MSRGANGQPYAPQPGTVGARVLDWLKTQPAGSEFAGPVVAEAIGHADNTMLLSYLRDGVIKHGLVAVRRVHGLRGSLLSLGDGAPVAGPPDEDEPLEHPPEDRDGQRVASVFDLGARAVARPARDVAAAELTPAAPAPQRPLAPLVGLNATVSMSGEITIVAECGTVVLFAAERARQLVGFLAGRAG